MKVAGGLRVTEPCADLAAAVTVVSSLMSRKIRAGVALIGEIGLGGELRRAKGVEARISEAAKLGFRMIVVPAYVVSKSKRLSDSAREIRADGGKDASCCFDHFVLR